MAALTKPKSIRVSVGSVSVMIYFTDGRWTIVWRKGKGSPPQRTTRMNLADARSKAEEICLTILNGQTKADELSSDDRLQTVAARQALAGTGMAIDAAAREVAEALRISRGQAGLAEMARFWQRHHPGASGPPRTVDQVHAELVEDRRDHDLNARYRSSLEQELKTFAQAFAGQLISEVTADEIRDYLRGLNVTWRTRNNKRAGIITLFRFAQSRQYLPQDRDTEPEKVTKLKRPRGEHSRPGVLTALELRDVLEHCKSQWLPLVALSAFAGLRRAEVQRLDWSDVLWEERLIHVRQEVAKSTTRVAGDERYVPMRDNLLAWLAPWRERTSGTVCERVEFEDELKRLRKSGVIKSSWPKNCLRHSYGSYRAGEIKNLPQVADEMGNSVQECKKSYRNPRTERDVAAWASLFPAGHSVPSNVVAMAHNGA